MLQYSGGGTGVPLISADESPCFETICVSVKGPIAALQATLKTFHRLGYADLNDWSKPQPS